MDTASVIIPTYNRAGLVTEAMDSVRTQKYRPIELLVVDDGSTDDTEAVVRNWIDQYHQEQQLRTRYLYQDNQGAPVARNRGMEAAIGDYLLFLDSDDELADSALNTLVHAHKKRQAGAVYGGYLRVYEDGRGKKLNKQYPVSENSVVNVLQNCPCTPTVLLDRKVVEDVRWRENLPCAQEFGFFLDLALTGVTFEWVDEVVARALDHSDGVRIKNNHADGVTMAQTIGTYLLDVENDLRAHGKEESAACDRALLYFAGLLASKGERPLARKLLDSANRGRFVGRMCSELSIPGRYPLLASLIGVRGTEMAIRAKRTLQDAFR